MNIASYVKGNGHQKILQLWLRGGKRGIWRERHGHFGTPLNSKAVRNNQHDTYFKGKKNSDLGQYLLGKREQNLAKQMLEWDFCFSFSPVSQTVPAASSQKDETSARAAHGGSTSKGPEQAAGWDTPSLQQQQAIQSVQAASWIFTLHSALNQAY